MYETGAKTHYQNNLNLCASNDSRVYRAIRNREKQAVPTDGEVMDAISLVQIKTDAQYTKRPSEAGTIAARREAFQYCLQYWSEES